jgi:prevent-host-death family protein
MRVFREQTAVAAVSELRTRLDAILHQLGKTSVVIERHNKPVAVLVDPAEFERMQEAVENASDLILAFDARRRELSQEKGGYLPLDEAEKRAL